MVVVVAAALWLWWRWPAAGAGVVCMKGGAGEWGRDDDRMGAAHVAQVIGMDDGDVGRRDRGDGDATSRRQLRTQRRQQRPEKHRPCDRAVTCGPCVAFEFWASSSRLSLSLLSMQSGGRSAARPARRGRLAVRGRRGWAKDLKFWSPVATTKLQPEGGCRL